MTLTSETMANRNHPSQAGVQQLMANLPGEWVHWKALFAVISTRAYELQMCEESSLLFISPQNTCVNYFSCVCQIIEQNNSQLVYFSLQAGRKSAGIMDIQQKALASGGKERLGPSSKALVATGGTKSSTALVQQKKAATLPKPQWHPPWKLMRVGVWLSDINHGLLNVAYIDFWVYTKSIIYSNQ